MILGYIDFESPAAGTVYGPPVHSPGSIAFVDAGVPFTLREFALVGGGATYGTATVRSLSPGQWLELNNITISADFFVHPVAEVSFEYLDKVGEKNLRVNGHALHSVATLAGIPPIVAPGVQFSYTSHPISPVAASGTWGKIVLQGPVRRLDLGGQEFFIDNFLWSGP